MIHTFCYSILFACMVTTTFAQDYSPLELQKEVGKLDSLLFDAGFNRCEINQFEKLISENFEFYHDESGITNGKEEFITGIREGLCKLPYKPRRELQAGSMQVFPLKKAGQLYGAVQVGVHCFYAKEEGVPERLTSTAKFTHLWLIEHGQWRLSRVISYDHQQP